MQYDLLVILTQLQIRPLEEEEEEEEEEEKKKKKK